MLRDALAADGAEQRLAAGGKDHEAEGTRHVLRHGRDLAGFEDVVEEEEVDREEAHDQQDIGNSSHGSIVGRAATALEWASARECHLNESESAVASKVMQALRWTGIIFCAAIATASLVYGTVSRITEGWSRLVISDWGWAVLFGVAAVLLWRRVGPRHAIVVYGLLMLGFVGVYFVLVELHAHGYLGPT
jgi:hypothetical protein